MAATATDYQWISDLPVNLREGYCLTLVRGTTVADFLRGVQAEARGDAHGLVELEQRAWAAWDEHDGSRFVVGATSVPGEQGEWVLGLEINGFLGIRENLVGPLSRGTRLVSHFRNVNAVDRFKWFEDGELRTTFEPLFPRHREGSAPDELLETMSEVGFDLRKERGDVEFDPTGAAFALAARLTGVDITAGLLSDATFTTGLVPKSAL